jgi:hypothetical protein
MLPKLKKEKIIEYEMKKVKTYLVLASIHILRFVLLAFASYQRDKHITSINQGTQSEFQFQSFLKFIFFIT